MLIDNGKKIVRTVAIMLIGGVWLMSNSCSVGEGTTDKQAMMQTDRDFSTYSENEGMIEAFDRFMTDDARMLQAGSDEIVGREACIKSLGESTGKSLTWEPTFAEISETGDLGYTIGEWKMVVVDSTNESKEYFGNYVTIWKKQQDGEWKFVFDTGTSKPSHK